MRSVVVSPLSVIRSGVATLSPLLTVCLYCPVTAYMCVSKELLSRNSVANTRNVTGSNGGNSVADWLPGFCFLGQVSHQV